MTIEQTLAIEERWAQDKAASRPDGKVLYCANCGSVRYYTMVGGDIDCYNCETVGQGRIRGTVTSAQARLRAWFGTQQAFNELIADARTSATEYETAFGAGFSGAEPGTHEQAQTTESLYAWQAESLGRA